MFRKMRHRRQAMKSFKKAQQLMDSGLLPEAQNLLESIQSELCENAHFHLHYALLLSLRQEHERGLQAIDKALAIEEENPVFLMIKAEILYEMGALEPAQQEIKRSIALDELNGRAQYDLGKILVALGQLDEAYEPFAKATRLEKGLLAGRLLTMAELFILRHRQN